MGSSLSLSLSCSMWCFRIGVLRRQRVLFAIQIQWYIDNWKRDRSQKRPLMTTTTSARARELKNIEKNKVPEKERDINWVHLNRHVEETSLIRFYSNTLYYKRNVSSSIRNASFAHTHTHICCSYCEKLAVNLVATAKKTQQYRRLIYVTNSRQWQPCVSMRTYFMPMFNTQEIVDNFLLSHASTKAFFSSFSPFHFLQWK